MNHDPWFVDDGRPLHQCKDCHSSFADAWDLWVHEAKWCPSRGNAIFDSVLRPEWMPPVDMPVSDQEVAEAIESIITALPEEEA